MKVLHCTYMRISESFVSCCGCLAVPPTCGMCIVLWCAVHLLPCGIHAWCVLCCAVLWWAQSAILQESVCMTGGMAGVLGVVGVAG